MLCSRSACVCLAACALTATVSGAGVAQSSDSSATAPRDSARKLAPVVVTGDARRSGYAVSRTTTATKTDVPLRDVPQAVTVLGRQLIADQAMQSMADVVRYVPGVTMGLGEGHRDAPTIRGNSSTADFFVDGVRDDAQYLRDLYNVERVEALKGSNAMVFGRGGGGGVINRVTKEAQWAPTRAATFEGGSFEHKRATLDVGDAVAGHVLALRLNGMLESSGLFRTPGTLEREGVNPTASLLAGGALVRLGVEYFADRRTVDRGIPSFQGRPFAAAAGSYFGDADVNRSRAVVRAASALVERGVGGGVMLRNRTRWTDYDKFYQNIYPSATNAAGTQVSLSAYNHAIGRSNVFNQTDLTWERATGPVRHTLLAGAEVGRQRTEQLRETGYFSDSLTSVAVAFDRPVLAAPLEFRQSATDADSRATTGLAAAYVQDQVALTSYLQAIAGVRYDRFDLRYHNDRTGQELRRDDRMISPRAGLVLKPREPLSLYGAYSVSHLPSSGDQFTALTATTQGLEPERFTNRELGAKWAPRADLSLSGAVYRLDRTNTTAPDPTDAAKVVQTGSQRTTGVEAGVTGSLTNWWQVAGGYAAQRARIVSRTSAARAGATVPLVPRHTVSLWNRVQFARALGAGLGVVHQAKMFAAVDNAVTLPAFTRLDAAAFVRLGRGVRAQLNVENLLDREYFPTSHGNNNIMPGAPRTVRLSVTMAP